MVLQPRFFESKDVVKSNKTLDKPKRYTLSYVTVQERDAHGQAGVGSLSRGAHAPSMAKLCQTDLCWYCIASFKKILNVLRYLYTLSKIY